MFEGLKRGNNQPAAGDGDYFHSNRARDDRDWEEQRRRTGRSQLKSTCTVRSPTEMIFQFPMTGKHKH